MNDAEQTQARLRDRLATADLRLSVLVDPDLLPWVAAVECEKPPAPLAWWMEPYAPDLTQRMLNGYRHHRRRRGLIALKACRAYVGSIAR